MSKDKQELIAQRILTVAAQLLASAAELYGEELVPTVFILGGAVQALQDVLVESQPFTFGKREE